MIRYTILLGFSGFIIIYAWKDWYKALCGLILLAAFLERPDMPRQMMGIHGANPFNLLLMVVVCAWLLDRWKQNLEWDLPRHINLLLILYALVIVISGLRLMMNPTWELKIWWYYTGHDAPSTLGYINTYFINTLKWAIPGLLILDGCRDEDRTRWALFSLLLIYFLLSLQAIKAMPLGAVMSGEDLMKTSLRVLQKRVGYHRVDLSMMFAGASWACFVMTPMFNNRMNKLIMIGCGGIIMIGQALTGGRTGYFTWILIGGTFAVIKYRKLILLGPLLAILVVQFVPAVSERLFQGFGSSEDHLNYSTDPDLDVDVVTAGRNLIWPHVIDKIKEAPIAGHGRLGMIQTGLARFAAVELKDRFGHPHNAYLEVLLDMGIFGFIPIMLFFGLVIKYGLSLFLDKSNAIYTVTGGVATALVMAQMLASMGSQTFYPREGTLGMWCAIGLMLRVYFYRKTYVLSADQSDAVSDSSIAGQSFGQPGPRGQHNA